MKKIINSLVNLKKNYDGYIQILPGLTFSQKDKIRLVEFYGNSKYLNGQKDEFGRIKFFYNVLNGICDVENAAKDIDTKDVWAVSDDGEHYTESFILSKDIYEWMKEANFAQTLNEMIDTHTRYGSLLAKKVIKDGELRIEIPEWKNLITDQVDIINNPIVEIHYLTPAEILEMEGWDLSNVPEKWLESNKRLPVYEVRGKFSLAHYKECIGQKYTKADERKFSNQLYYFIGEPGSELEDSKDINEKLVLVYWENNVEQVYKYLARKKKAGRAFGVGVFEEGEEAQAGINDAVLKQMRAMEYTTKVIAQTASKKLRGRNLLVEADDGTILEHEEGKPITNLQLGPSGGLAQFQNLIDQWYNQLQKTTSSYEVQRGEQPPSGTPFRLGALILQQSSSVFEKLREDLGIFITEIFNDWIMPHLAKKLNKEHILAHEFSLEELKEIDRNFAINQANEIAKEQLLSGRIVTSEQYEDLVKSITEQLTKTKNKRFLEIPKDYYKNLKAKITINVTGEQRNKAATLESLVNIMMIYAKNPNLTQDPVLNQIFMKIVELSGAGISPVSLMGAITEKAPETPQNAVTGSKIPPPPQTPQGGANIALQGLPEGSLPEGELSLGANPVPQL